MLDLQLHDVDASIPLVVDMDGTITPVDTLHEGLVRAFQANPSIFFKLPLWLMRGRADFKREVANVAPVAPELVPWRTDLLAAIRAERDRGRRVALASAADWQVAAAVADHLQCFDVVVASAPGNNLKGQAKLQAIQAQLGESFIYIGDSTADLPIWNASIHAIAVGAGAALAGAIRAPRSHVVAVARPAFRDWVEAIRIHQWVKNVLVFAALFLAPSSWSLWSAVDAMLAFLAFGMTASATYLWNDIWDISRDRQHPRKRHRALARGLITVRAGLAAGLLLLGAGLLLAASVGWAFTLALVGYVILTLLYSWHLKQYIIIDVMTLAVLYTWRVIAGAVATQVTVSPWLLAFCVFLFLGLALVKRFAELQLLAREGRVAAIGRDYRVADLALLLPFGIASSVAAALVLCLYAASQEVMRRHGWPELLWLVALALMYWMSRMWIKTARGEMADDPIVFSFRDRGSLAVIVFMVVLTAGAILIPNPT
jgi:4-hydroxybenzoate polyprenyltransferase/phosphoserine phosphatase